MLIATPIYNLYIYVFYFRTTHDLNVFVEGKMSNNQIFTTYALEFSDLLYQSLGDYIKYVCLTI